MVSDLRGKTAIVTGASSGLGRRLALDLAEEGANLVLADLNAAGLAEVSEKVRERGSAVLVRPTDVTIPEQCWKLIESAVERFGAIDYLVLSAGISMWSRLEEVSDVTIFRKLMEINYLGAVYCIHPALSYLRQSGGTIVAITSTQAVIGLPSHTGYSAAKHALKGFLESLELEEGQRIRILNVLPGWIRGTSLRTSALSGDGSAVGASRRKHSKESVGLDRCSAAIVRAMKGRTRELYIPPKLKFLPWLKLLAPGWLRRKITKAVEKQE